MGVVVHEGPLTPEEEAYGYAYADTLAVGAPEPSTEDLDPERCAEIRRVLEEAWRAKVRRIYRHKAT